MAQAKKDNDPTGCLSCAGVLLVIGVLVAVGGLIGSGDLPSSAWIFFALAVGAFIVHQTGGKNAGKMGKGKGKTQNATAGGRQLPSGWVWLPETTQISRLWDDEADMFDATTYVNVAHGRSHRHDVALVTPQGGRSRGHYLVARLNTALPEFDHVIGTPAPAVPGLDPEFFEDAAILGVEGRPHGIRNGCYWVEIDDYSTFAFSSLVNDFAAMVQDYDQADEKALEPKTNQPQTSSDWRPDNTQPFQFDPAPAAQWPASPPVSAASTAAPEWPAPQGLPPSVSSQTPSPGQPMAFEDVDHVDSTGKSISGRRAPRSAPKFEEPAEWTIPQWKPSSEWKPDSSWQAPSYTPTSWEAPGGSSLFGAPSSLARDEDEAKPGRANKGSAPDGSNDGKAPNVDERA